MAKPDSQLVSSYAQPSPPPRSELAAQRQHGQLRRALGILGPGLITGAADDDPSGIATYSQTGAQFGYAQLWTALWMLPLVTGVQEACGRIGNITGQGLARNIKNKYSLRTLRLLVVLLAATNVINIGADIGALGAAAALIIHVPVAVLMAGFTAAILALEIRVSYRRYARVLKWLAVSLLACPITALLVPQPWATIVRATFVPHIEFSAAFFYIITAVIGTTITPYMFFWQTSQEAEENRGRKVRRSLLDLRTDNAIGMFISQAVAWFIIITGATVLHTAHITTINTAADAARALEPMVETFAHSGEIAQALFAVGIVSLGMLAIPVMAGSTSYALTEAGLAGGPRPQARAGPELLWRHRRVHADRPGPELHRRQPHPRAGVRRGIQRHRRHPADLVHRPHRHRPPRHGRRSQQLAVPHHPGDHLHRRDRLGGGPGHLLPQGLTNENPAAAAPAHQPGA
jgi:NRAMP (natural resistance-associated macrophage protein)-like metal ion transporter